MYITVRSILKEPVFEDAKVLSGKQFLENKVSRVSVFDCPFTLLSWKLGLSRLEIFFYLV